MFKISHLVFYLDLIIIHFLSYHFYCFFSWNHNHMSTPLAFQFKIHANSGYFPQFTSTRMLLFSSNNITNIIFHFKSPQNLYCFYCLKRFSISSLPNTCIISYKSGVLVLFVKATLKTVLTSPTCAAYIPGFVLNSLTSFA